MCVTGGCSRDSCAASTELAALKKLASLDVPIDFANLVKGQAAETFVRTLLERAELGSLDWASKPS